MIRHEFKIVIINYLIINLQSVLMKKVDHIQE